MRLEVENVTKWFGGLKALTDVSFVAESGELTAIIGPNGAGKTTLFSCIGGYHRVDRGQVRLDDQAVTGLPPAAILRLGLARTFQLVRSFEGLTVLETVMTAGHARSGQGLLASALALPRIRRSERALEREAYETLEALSVGHLRDHRISELPYGQQRLVEIAKVLMTGADVLLLDEPAAGLHASEVEALSRVLESIRATGRTVLMIEHNMPFLMALADKVVVLDFGRKIAEGTPDEVSRDPEVRRAYLGQVEEHAGDH